MTLKRSVLAFLLILTILPIFPALAGTPAGTAPTATSKGSFPSPAPTSVTIVTGTIYSANLDGQHSTYRWAGVYGNVTGTIILGDSASNILYQWTAIGKYVYLDDDTTVDWPNLLAATCTDVENVYSFLTGASDNCANTFTGSASFNSGLIPLTIASTIAASTLNNASTAVWDTLALKDGTNNDVVFVGVAQNPAAYAYNGELANYQVIIPESSTVGTQWNIWIELQ